MWLSRIKTERAMNLYEICAQIGHAVHSAAFTIGQPRVGIRPEFESARTYILL